MVRIPVQTETNLVRELRALIEGPVRTASQEVTAQISFREMGHPQPGAFHDAPWWILKAQSGALEKFAVFFSEDRPLGSMELLAMARNIFETLVWLKLFGIDLQFGLVFYARFLDQQNETQVKHIEKIEQEAELFETCSDLDNDALSSALNAALGSGVGADAIESARVQRKSEACILDDQARREFTIYAAAAKFNGYAYQAHLIRTKALPEHREMLSKIKEHMVRFEADRDTLLSGRYRAMANWDVRWNWKERAKEVGLLRQYDFLYGYTSRLLHAMPMNLITESTLSTDERILMLEYLYVAMRDALDEIARFTFPGKIGVVVLTESEEPASA